jgi:hypothetical protein
MAIESVVSGLLRCGMLSAGHGNFWCRLFFSKKATTKTNAKANAREGEDDPGLFDDAG